MAVPGTPATSAPPPTVAPPTGPSGPPSDSPTPDYADYFNYANGVGPTINGKTYGYAGGTPMDTGGYTEPTNTPDRYKGLLTYKGDPNNPTAYDGLQLNKDVLAKLPPTKFGTVDNVQAVDKLGGSQKMKNPNLKYYDEHYGWITPKSNLYEEEHGVQKYAVPVMQALASAAFGGVGGLAGAGMGAWTGGAGALAGAAQGVGEGAGLGQTLLRVAPALIGGGLSMGGFSLPPELAQALKYARYAKTGYDGYNMFRGR